LSTRATLVDTAATAIIVRGRDNSVTKTVECGCKVWRVWRRVIGGLVMAEEKFKYSKTFPLVVSWTLSISIQNFRSKIMHYNEPNYVI
jgi:hypothetical protein